MYVEGAAYLVSLSTPLGLTFANYIDQCESSRAIQPVMDAIRRQVSLYKSENFVVRTILTDGEGAVLACARLLHEKGIRINHLVLGSTCRQ